MLEYLNVLGHLKEFKVDRIILSDFSEVWSKVGSLTTTLDPEFATVNSNALKLMGIKAKDYVYTTLEKAIRLDDRESVQLHIYSNETVQAETFEVILSDSKNLVTAIESLTLPELVADSMNIVEVAISDADRLSNIKSVGLKALADSTATLYLGSITATTDKFIVTVEELNDRIDIDGTNYVLSKLGSGYSAVPTDLMDAVYMYAAGRAWLKQKENENNQNDYGLQGTTRNYGMKLLDLAKIRVEEYIAQGDVESGDGTTEQRYINTNILGGSDTDGTITDGTYVYVPEPILPRRRLRR